MSTWDDKPNDYEHAIAEIEQLLRRTHNAEATILDLRAEVERLHQHIGWLKQYIGGMTPENWRDMKLRAERQLNEAALADQGKGPSWER